MERRVIADLGDWDDMRSAFRWRIPPSFNLGAACCDDWARIDPGRLAIRHEDENGRSEDWTFGRLQETSDRLASAMRARGVKAGDRVAVVMPQHPAVIVTHLAAWKLGAISLPIFALFGDDALLFRLQDSGAKALVAMDDTVERVLALKEALPELEVIYGLGPTPAGAFDLWADIKRAAPIVGPVETRAEDPAVMIYTSGTTGPPKGVLHAHRFLFGHLPAVELCYNGFPKQGDMGWTPADWAWIGGLMDMAVPCLYYGVPQISRRFRKFDPEVAIDLIRRHGVRNLFLPPTALKLMRAAGVGGDLGIRSIGSGGESLGADLLDWGRDALGVTINEFYGQTECNLVTSGSSMVLPVKPGTIGRAVPGHEVAILGSDGEPLPAGEMGEISVRAPDPAMFLGYWRQPEKTAAKFRGDWMGTGDLGTMDDAGYIT
ncbi:MAG: AMP-binding protein, partial [Pseudomonadota bacterium]